MSYESHYPLNFVKRGSEVIVALKGHSSDVLLVDANNYAKLKRGQKYSYYGGHYNSSPIILSVPTSDNWHVIIRSNSSFQSNVRVKSFGG